MSSYKFHILGYIALATLLLMVFSYYKIGLEEDLLILGNLTGILYSILPDVDTPSSKIRMLVNRISLVLIFSSLVAYIVLNSLIFIYISIIFTVLILSLCFVRHRGIFHTIWAGFILSIPLYIINPYLVIFAILGFLSHIAVDSIL